MVKSQGKENQEEVIAPKIAATIGRSVKRLATSDVEVVMATEKPERKIPARILNIMWRNKVPYHTALGLVRKEAEDGA